MLAVRSRGRVAEAGGVRPPSQPLLLCWCRFQFTHHSSPFTLHPSLFTLHPSLFTLHSSLLHFFTTFPDFMTKLTCSIRDMSVSGSPATAIKSAERPGSIDPNSSVAPSIVAALIVADWIACMGVMPYLTM